ncbi:AraC family transcriptional regulator [Marinobacter vulgaris]|uniref:AraC family transcriptional regulator n=1 Tax=Marinobacter vulgaris TaxID=1928331 RepID=A0A2V3ZJ80_9GAMM|nr:AraC family transcriptional regulator [Marinobacter vulgaris]PXX90427.1 AraC family transcriptional regulator [Marinobacter vulgaris]TSJ69545.1 AraC family transcriptional regulator [Marinobacter vulgaris]
MRPITRHKNPLGDISVLYVAVMARAIRAEGEDPADLLGRFGLNEQALGTPEARISIPRFMRMGQAAIALTGNPALGLTMGQLSRPVDAGIAGLAAQSAPTAGAAIDTLIRYALLTSRNSRGVPWTADRGREAHFYSIKPYNVFNFFVVDSVLAAWTRFLRVITGQEEVIERVTIEYPSRNMADLFEQWFACPVRFGAEGNSLRLAPGVADAVSLQAQPAMFEQLSADCQQDLARIRAGWSTGDRVKDLLPALMQGDTPTLATIAERLGMAPWTLQRLLAEENTGFRELVDETRKELAMEYIRETRASLSEIAWLLGFANPAAFHKAWRRWFATSPGEHRKQYLAEQNDKGLR